MDNLCEERIYRGSKRSFGYCTKNAKYKYVGENRCTQHVPKEFRKKL